MYKKSLNKILIIVAHTDDETLGVGGTLLKHKNAGDIIYGISMTDGFSSRKSSNDKKINQRKKAAEKAGKLLGIEWIDFGNFPDNAMDLCPPFEVIKFIEDVKNKINPNLIYTHSYSDLNIDHRIVNQATLTAFRPKADQSWNEIRAFEVPSATDYGHKSLGCFNPNLYINIQESIRTKIKSFSYYKDEILSSPNSRSLHMIKVLAEYRGSQVGLNYAEAFEVLRK